MDNNAERTFERREYKYRLTREQRERLMADIGDKIKPDKYCRADISSLYFDTPDKLLIRRSLEKPLYKEKLRLRSYGGVRAGETAYLELKKKFDGVVYKRREAMSLEAALSYLAGGRPDRETQITREIDYFIAFYGKLEPSLLISVTREAYAGAYDAGLRITFDSDILWRETDLDLSSGRHGRALLPEGSCLMEIKTPTAIPLWLAHELSRLRLFKESFSKYGSAYLETLSTKGERRGVCA